MINSTYKKANRLLHFIFLVFFVQLGYTQIYPVQVNSNVIPPYLSSVSKYTTATNQKYLVNIFTNDLNVVNRQVKLKLYIQGNGINAQSAPVVVGANPLFINGGESLQLNNLDLAPYFEFQNLQGINPQQYSGVLPQGSYNFCIEVYDFVTNQPISQKSCTFFYFIYNEPPLLNLPLNHDVIHFQDPQNIIFTWSPRHSNATNIEYEFTLIELLDNQAPSNYAFVVGAPVWQEVLSNTILNYNFNYPQLTAGKKYAWRVKALTQPGFGEDAIFNNNGYSEIYDFVYAGNCNTPEFVLAQSTSATQAKILWQNNPNHLSNSVKFRKSGTQEWFNAPVANGQALLLDLEPNASYEFQVGGICLGNITSFSAINQFTQPAQDVVAINCGIAPTIDLANVTLYSEELKKDMVFMAADYAIHINESQGVGTYTGKGWTRAPFFKNIKIAVEFENIKLNSELKLVEGEVKAQYDPSWGNILDVNKVIDVVDDILDPLQASNDVHSYQVDFVIGSTANITVQNGQIIITTPQGVTGAIFDFDKGENTTITDANGTVYTVDPKGNVTLGQQGTGIANSSNTENINSDGKVTALSTIGAKVVFKRSSRSVAFDDTSAAYTNLPTKLASKYKTIKDSDGNDYPFYYKAVVNKEDGTKTVDYVTAEITITDTIVKAKDIIFSLNGLKVTATDSITNGNVTVKTLEIPVFTTIGEPELVALVKDGTEKQKVIGAMTVIPIKDVGTVNISLVPVNGVTISSADIEAVKRIYSQAGVTLNITTLPAYQDRSITTLECGTSGFIANYTTEQNAFIDRYKASKTVSDNQYLLFVTKDITPSRPISGFMPLHRQFGFVFTGQSQSSTEEIKETSGSGLATVIAHEIGHGVFELQHPWEQYYNKNSFSTNWLMDYASGTKLPYMHWQQISHPKTALYLFQSDSSGEKIAEGFNYIMPNHKSFRFQTNDGKKDSDIINVDHINNGGHPNGTLYAFNINGKEYEFGFDSKKATEAFYEKGSDIAYTNAYNTTFEEQSYRLLIQQAANSCNYYLAIRKKPNLLNPVLTILPAEVPKTASNCSKILLNEVSVNGGTIDCSLIAEIKIDNPGSIAFRVNRAVKECLEAIKTSERVSMINALLPYLGNIEDAKSKTALEAMNREIGDTKNFVSNVFNTGDQYDVGKAIARLTSTGVENNDFQREIINIVKKNNYALLIKMLGECDFDEVTHPFIDEVSIAFMANPNVANTTRALEVLGETLRYPSSLMPYIIGLKPNESISSDKDQLHAQYTVLSKLPITFNSNGTINLKESYSEYFKGKGIDDMTFPSLYDNPTADPFEATIFLIGIDNNELGLQKDKVIVMPAIWGLCIEKAIAEHKKARIWRHVGNGAAVIGAIVAAVPSGGTSVVAAIAILGGEAAVLDELMMMSKDDVTFEQYQRNKELYEKWDLVYNSIMMVDGLVNAPELAKTLGGLVQRMRSISYLKSASKFLQPEFVTALKLALQDIAKYKNIAVIKLGIKNTINYTKFAFKSTDNFIDIIIHTKGNKFYVVVEGVVQEKSSKEIISIIDNTPTGKTARLLSCNDEAAAIALSIETKKPFYASDGWVEINKNGDVFSEKDFYLYNRGTRGTKGSNYTKGNATEGVEYLRLGDGLQGAGNRVARSIEQIAPNGIIPSNSQTNNLFHKWFDDLIPEELDLVLGNPSLKEALEARIRYPGGLHEWCMVCEIKTFKSWEISMSEIHRFRTKTLDLTGINPTTGANFVHGGAGSTAFHNELRTMIQSSTSLTDFNTKLAQLVNRWQIDPSLLPPLIK